MRQVYRFAQRVLLLVLIATICILFILRISSDFNGFANSVMDPKTLEDYYHTKHLPHVDLGNLSYSTDSASRCKFQSPYLLILIHSGPAHFILRSTIRKTWGSVPNILGHSIRVVFLLGETEGAIGSKLHREMEEHKDIVKGNFQDSYKNLTYKHLLGYKWFLTNCEHADIVMKVDDDVFVDVFRTVHILTKTFGLHPTSLLAGLLWRFMSVYREGKWAVSKEQYPFDTYPDYLSGLAYFITPDVARRMYSVVESVPFLWIDDVFMTGFVADAAHVMKTDLSVRFEAGDTFLIKWLLGNSIEPSPWIASQVEQHRWPEDVLRLWNKTVKTWGINSLS